MAGLYDGVPGLLDGVGLEWIQGLAGGPGLTNTTGSAPVVNSFLLLQDGTSFLLLEDGTSELILEP